MFEEKEQIHDFEFDAHRDSPNIELLDWGYKTQRYDVTATGPTYKDAREDNGRLPAQDVSENVASRGKAVYAKWQDKRTGKVYEDYVDLDKRLPSDVSDRKVYMLIDDNQMYVYLVPYKMAWSEEKQDWDLWSTKNLLPQGQAANGPKIYADRNVKTIYPDNSPAKVRGGE